MMRYARPYPALILLLISFFLVGGRIVAQDTPQPGDSYTIQFGDTLDVLGQRWNVSVVSIRLANDLAAGQMLKPGDTIVVPQDGVPYGAYPPLNRLQDASDGQGGGVAGEEYVLQPLDTLDVVGQRLNVSVQAIIAANNITPRTMLRPGDVIIIPSDAPPYGVFPPLNRLVPLPQGEDGQGGGVAGEEYVLQPLDTLDVVGQRLNVSVQAIIAANNITPGMILRAGDVLLIPADAPPYGVFPALQTTSAADASDGQGGGAAGEIYVIQPGDTIDHVSAQFNLQTDCVLEANNLRRGDLVVPGLAIVMASACPPYDGYDFVPSGR